MPELFDSGLESMFSGETFQISLLSTGNEQLVFVPGSALLTNGLNRYISKIRGKKRLVQINSVPDMHPAEYFTEKYIPFDTIVKTEAGESCFERYVQDVLKKDIQKEQFGCKITDTHMRLGSTIHISQFYEAELLFGNKYFVSRFALLILRTIYPQLEYNKKLSLYGYGIYSESLLVELCNAVRNLKMGIDVDYIFLERKEEKREFSHSDRIRYSRIFPDPKAREEYTKGRKHIIIVPVNSTMKTHQRLIDLMEEENFLKGTDWILYNFALILVGSHKANTYWKKTKTMKNC